MLILASVFINSCTNNPKLSHVELSLLNENNALINEIGQFVQASLFAGMIQVRQENRLAWNRLLSVYACGSQFADHEVPSLLTKLQADFQTSMQATAMQVDVFLSAKEQAILADVSQTAFRLFSATYAAGYARQIGLANEIDNSAQNDFCGGQIHPLPTNLTAFATNLTWKSSEYAGGVTEKTFGPHLKYGIKVFGETVKQQGRLFEALVYSHAYQRTDQYKILFFEVNKFENVESYSARVYRSARIVDTDKNVAGQNDFAYLVLASGYHWGMMSVLAILEQDFSDLHQRKKHFSEKLLDEVTHKKIR